MAANAKIDIDAKIHTDAKVDTNTKININMKISINKPIFYFPHAPREISSDRMLVRIKVQDMKMAKWNLSKEVQIRPSNLGTHDKFQVVKLNVDLDSFIIGAT
jgi:hypothetical protein